MAYPMYPRLQGGLKFKQGQLLTNHAGKVFLPGGEVPELGQVVTNPELADALALLAANGRDGFYTGEQARRMVRECADWVVSGPRQTWPTTG